MTTVTTLTYDQVMAKLPAIVADCLGLDEEEITPDLVICPDKESIEILDLSFRCEKAFQIKSPFKLFLGSRDYLTLDADGNLSPESLRRIREVYPFFAAKYEAGGRMQLKPHELLEYFTVEMIARFVVQAVAEQAANSQAA